MSVRQKPRPKPPPPPKTSRPRPRAFQARDDFSEFEADMNVRNSPTMSPTRRPAGTQATRMPPRRLSFGAPEPNQDQGEEAFNEAAEESEMNERQKPRPKPPPPPKTSRPRPRAYQARDDFLEPEEETEMNERVNESEDFFIEEEETDMSERQVDPYRKPIDKAWEANNPISWTLNGQQG